MRKSLDSLKRIRDLGVLFGLYYLICPSIMQTIRNARRPCLPYKILAAGRSVNSPKEVRERMAIALNGIKPTDPVIIGLYQRFNDEIGQTADFTRDILAATPLPRQARLRVVNFSYRALCFRH